MQASVGEVTVRRTGPLPSAGGYGRYQWEVVFRSNVGDVELLTAAYSSSLTGTDAAVSIVALVEGDGRSLLGDVPTLLVEQACPPAPFLYTYYKKLFRRDPPINCRWNLAHTFFY